MRKIKESPIPKWIAKNVILVIALGLIGSIAFYWYQNLQDKHQATTNMTLNISRADDAFKAGLVDDALTIYDKVLQEYEDYITPRIYAHVNCNMGTCWLLKSNKNDRKKCLERARTFFTEALKEIKRREFPYEYACVKNNLGITYSLLAEISCAKENLKLAISSFEDAMSVGVQHTEQQNLDQSLMNLALAYTNLSDIDSKREYAEKATITYAMIQHKRLMSTDSPFFVDAQNNLAILCSSLFECTGDYAYLIAAEIALTKPLEYYTIEDAPIAYARTLTASAKVFAQQAVFTADLNILNKSINAFEKALAIISKDEYPILYYNTLSNYARFKAFESDLLDDESEKLKAAQSAYSHIQEVIGYFTISKYPLDYATAKKHLGMIYDSLSNIENSEENLRKSIIADEEALEIYTELDYPIEFAELMGNLGYTYSKITWYSNEIGDVEIACQFYEKALTIFTKEDYPYYNILYQNSLNQLADNKNIDSSILYHINVSNLLYTH